jgi:hypothetical protein
MKTVGRLLSKLLLLIERGVSESFHSILQNWKDRRNRFPMSIEYLHNNANEYLPDKLVMQAAITFQCKSRINNRGHGDSLHVQPEDKQVETHCNNLPHLKTNAI